MKTSNEVAATILWILFGFFILHVIQGTGTKWIKSFFQSGSPAGSNSASATDSNQGTVGYNTTTVPYAVGEAGASILGLNSISATNPVVNPTQITRQGGPR